MRDAPSGIRSPPPAAAVAAGRAVHCGGRARRGGWSCGPGIARRELSAVLTSPAHARPPARPPAKDPKSWPSSHPSVCGSLLLA
ncbi:hypothetical protein VULLAG_LOCUS16311 [Vulpes lagopus]